MQNNNVLWTVGRFLLRLSAVLLGAFLGGVVWVLLSGVVGMASRAAHPQDPSAGSGVIVLHLLTPMGCIMGGTLAEKMVFGSAAHDADRVGEDDPVS